MGDVRDDLLVAVETWKTRAEEAASHEAELIAEVDRLRAEVSALTRQRDEAESKFATAAQRASDAFAAVERLTVEKDAALARAEEAERAAAESELLASRAVEDRNEAQAREADARAALAASEQARQEAERQRDSAREDHRRVCAECSDALDALAAARAEGEALRGALRWAQYRPDHHCTNTSCRGTDYPDPLAPFAIKGHDADCYIGRALSGPSATTGGPCPLGEACPDAHGYGAIHPAPPHPLADALAELMAAAQQAQPLLQEMRFTHCEGDSFRVTVQCIGRHAAAPPTGAPTTKGDDREDH